MGQPSNDFKQPNSQSLPELLQGPAVDVDELLHPPKNARLLIEEVV